MNPEVELTNISEHGENTIITIPNTETESPSCWHENRCTILFYSSTALGFLWVGLNLGGYI
tara:strand:- start:79 stop:261 length:183 start_codon:yes stop_codon:yes gene_type:complete